MAPRILLCGDVLGRFNALFKRIATVNKANGPFDVLLCVGQLFPKSNNIEELDEMLLYIQGQKEIPLPTYFIGDFGEGAASVLSAAKLESANQGFKMEGIPVCKNLYWLKGSGKFILHGLSVAYLAGRSSSNGSMVGVYCEDDIDALRAFAEESGVVDLFLTYPCMLHELKICEIVFAEYKKGQSRSLMCDWKFEIDFLAGILSGANLADAPPGIEHLSGGNAVISELVKELKPR
ncbi:hypothetical protein SUGI_0980670 [Cryptomeria japonica]|nr:hypothetical protein SUGI_0980670 [Cryptomeria japonica]